MGITLLKILLTPLLIAAATVASRRWGPTVGGWLVGLPLTSGPVSVFLRVEHSGDFAAAAAHSTLNGVLPVVAFCLVYERSARKHSWPFAVSCALGVYFVLVAVFTRVCPPLWASVALVFAGIALGITIIKPVADILPSVKPPCWDIPFRVAAATVLVVAITTVSGEIGPRLSGLLSSFPVFICVMSVSSHHLLGPVAIRKFERGVIMGSYAFAVFFVIVAATARDWNAVPVYFAAVAGALGTNYIIYRVLAFHGRRRF
ncbi:MAG: hypothetical protein LBR31_00440 [Desulfovibrio sp.]|jgi:hypothetical protein|nr:hypothetical protein [Desulfovibrio sp.]